MPQKNAAQVAPALAAMIVTQALVVAASLVPPVQGPAITAALALPAAWSGYYASIVFASALVSAQFAPRLIRRNGPLRASQWTLVWAALGLVCAATATLAGMIASAVLIGWAYAPGNPASSSLLARVVPPVRRAFVFSLKQTSIPIGGILAGVGAPLLVWLLAPSAGGATGIVGSAQSWTMVLGALAGLCILVGIGVQPWRALFDGPVVSAALAPSTKNVTGAGSATESRNGSRTEERTELGTGSGTSPEAQVSPLRLVAADPSLRTLALVSCTLASVQMAFGPIVVAFLAEEGNARLASAGAVLTFAMATSVALRIALGAVADRLGGTRVLSTIAFVMVAAALTCALVSIFGAARVPFALIAVMAGILGAAAFSWNGVYLAEVARAAPADAVASATAGTMTMVFLGGFIGPAVITTAIALTGNYATGFLVMAAFAAIAGVAILAAPLDRVNRSLGRPI